MGDAKAVLEEEYRRNIERQRLLRKVRIDLEDGNVAEAVDVLAHVVEMLSASEERVMRLHAECYAMIEHAGRVLQLHEMSRHVVIQQGATIPRCSGYADTIGGGAQVRCGDVAGHDGPHRHRQPGEWEPLQPSSEDPK